MVYQIHTKQFTEAREMNEREIIKLGLGIEEPWEIVGQVLDTSKKPYQLRIRLQAERGTEFPCPVCRKMCKVHDFKEKTWRHLNFFQHHCYITARVPRTRCPEHGVKLIEVPWARSGSRFTLLFEEAALVLVREMPVLTAAEQMEIDDKSLWRVVKHYVHKAISGLDLSGVKRIGVDETSSARGHKYVTIFIDLDREERPVLFVTEGKGKDTIARFRSYLEERGGGPEYIVCVVCDMSKAFIGGIEEEFRNAEIVVDWFHVVQIFNRAVDKVRRAEARERKMPRATRWAILKRGDGELTEEQSKVLEELESFAENTCIAWEIKERLRWINEAEFSQGARWRMTNFLNWAKERIEDRPIMKPVKQALETLERHKERILNRWGNDFTNARLESLNSIFQAARKRARGYRNVENFITMIYLLAAPIEQLLYSQIHTK